MPACKYSVNVMEIVPFSQSSLSPNSHVLREDITYHLCIDKILCQQVCVCVCVSQ